MLLSAALSFLLAAPSQAVNLIGLVLSGAFGSIAAAEAGACYMRDERHVPLERALVRFRVHTAGSIMQQLAMFFIIYLLGELGIHQNLLGAYAAGTPDPNLSLLLRTAGLILSAWLLLSALLIVRFTGKQRSANEFFEYVVPPLEGFWWQDEVDGVDYSDKSTFNWISVICLPDFVSKTDFEWAVTTATKKKKLDCSSAELLTVDEGMCVQIMHDGPFDDEPVTVALMDTYFPYCEEVGCDVWGMLLSMDSLCGEPVCLWLP
ncbi:MAG: GyrI-like domain-containing protein, partial [Candidatus Limiplasma sp.]|nr:GyrI-like domain-containing protein [Candidatus Limiplasma sp.]